MREGYERMKEESRSITKKDREFWIVDGLMPEL